MLSARLLRSNITRTTCASLRNTVVVAQQQRTLSSDCAPVRKLRCIFEEYRLQNFSRESPSRFKKEMMKAVECNNSDRGLIKIGLIEIDSLNRILVNIGRSDQLLTEDEIVTLMRDAGCASSGTAARTIPATTLYELV